MSTEINDYINKSSELKYELTEVLNKESTRFANIFTGMMNIKPAIFNKIRDLKYYRGGYPSENTPAKSIALVDNIAPLLITLEYFGDDELKNLFEERGITITFNDAKDLVEAEITAQTNNDFESYRVANDITKSQLKQEDRTRIFKELLERSMKTQEKICGANDILNLEHAPAAESLMNLKKRDFFDCVKFACKKLKNAKIEKAIEDYRSDMDSKVLANALIEDIVK